jgi:hypothetical protein
LSCLEAAPLQLPVALDRQLRHNLSAVVQTLDRQDPKADTDESGRTRRVLAIIASAPVGNSTRPKLTESVTIGTSSAATGPAGRAEWS